MLRIVGNIHKYIMHTYTYYALVQFIDVFLHVKKKMNEYLNYALFISYFVV